MSLLKIEGFDDGMSSSPNKWSTNTCPINAGGRTLNGGVLTPNGGAMIRQILSATEEHATIIVGCGLKPSFDMLSTTTDGFRFLSDTNTTLHVTVVPFAAGVINAYRNGTLLGSSAVNSYLDATFQFWEVKVILGDAPNGSVVVRINGVTVLNLTGIDTKEAGTKTVIDTVQIIETSNRGNGYIIDDIYICNGAGAVNNNFLGDCSVFTRFSDGNGFYSQGLGSDSNSIDNFLLVDENPNPNTTDYVAFAATGDKDTYNFGNLPAGTVYGVQQAAFAAKSDAGARSMRNIQRIAAVDYQTLPDHGLSVTPTYVGQFDMMQVSPATAVLWTVAEVNSAEFGTEARP